MTNLIQPTDAIDVAPDKEPSDLLTRFRRVAWMVWSVIVILQALIFPDGEAWLSAALLLVGGNLGLHTCLRTSLLREFPLSTTMLVGYLAYYFLLPPLATFVEWKPLTNNLVYPVLVQTHALATLICLLLAHALYRKVGIFQTIRYSLSERIYKPLGYFRVPNNLQILLIGSIGLAATAVQVLVMRASQQDATGVLNKIMQGLYPLAYLPYAILVRKVIGQEQRNERAWMWVLAAYTTPILILSMARNSRAAFLVGVMSIVLTYVYGVAVRLYSTRLFRAGPLALAIVGAAVVVGPVTDLATAMVIVREGRKDLSPTELISETFATFQNKQAIRTQRIEMSQSARDSTWDESYVDNLFLARMCNLKFPDNSLVLATSLTEGQARYMRELELQRVLAIFPRPVLNALDLPVDKDFVGSSSAGDLMLFVATENPNALAGYRTGSLFGSGFVAFGWFYPIVLGLLCMLTFTLADAQTTRAAVTSIGGVTTTRPVLSPVVATGFFAWVFYLTSAATGVESVSQLFGLILRGWVQDLVIYTLVFWTTGILSRPFMRD